MQCQPARRLATVVYMKLCICTRKRDIFGGLYAVVFKDSEGMTDSSASEPSGDSQKKDAKHPWPCGRPRKRPAEEVEPFEEVC